MLCLHSLRYCTLLTTAGVRVLRVQLCGLLPTVGARQAGTNFQVLWGICATGGASQVTKVEGETVLAKTYWPCRGFATNSISPNTYISPICYDYIPTELGHGFRCSPDAAVVVASL